MADFTQFEAVEPVIEPAKPQVIYDKYWLETLVIRAPDPKQDAKLSARFKLYNDVTREFAPNVEFVSLEIPSLFATAAQDILVATAMETVFQALAAELQKKLTYVPPPVEEPTPEEPPPVVEETTTTTTAEVIEESTETTTTQGI